MGASADLTRLDPYSFEHMVNLLALRVLGPGHTGFGPGSDGGRDGFYFGEAPYPSSEKRWRGRWYIQSKFHSQNLSKDPQKWLLERIEEEIKEFKKPDSKRQWPDNWIIATNIEPSGRPMTGAFDKANEMVRRARPKLGNRFHIWGGRKVLDFLALHPEVQQYYEHFLTPGHILTAVYDQLKDSQAEAKTILRHLIVRQFGEQQFTKLEQAGSAADTRPGIHKLFIDLPFRAGESELQGLITEYLVKTSARNHRIDPKQPDTKAWRMWNRHPSRARVWFVKGGPGQGKSTVSQYFCQVQRAALILQDDGPTVSPQQRSVAREIHRVSREAGFWPTVPRIPMSIELKEYAQWYGLRRPGTARGILSYLASQIEAGVEQKVQVGTLKRALQTKSWFIVFDGLDEVPHDVKDGVASEVCNFVDNVALELETDLLTVCTSRPQGYSGQFSQLDGPTIDLVNLSAARALQCAKPVLELDRSADEARKTLQILTSAVESSSVRDLMTTPLQAHIMAVVVRDGGRPPDRRWQLFTNFYQVIKRREANRDLPDKRLAKLLREDTQLLKSVHNKLGFVLQAMAETSKGAQTSLKRSEFELLVTKAVSQMIEGETAKTVGILMEATTDRLVLVSTPDDGDHVRFDIRPLQEFFAAEFFYEAVGAETLHRRLELVAGDSHWREVMHFLVSALIENSRLTELAVAVEALQRLDVGGGEPHARLFLRRLGRGALLAARLLQEGVLEQDKRIRQQLRKCLEPITGFIDHQPLKALASITQPNSRAWLIAFLFDSLREQDYTENIGATILLTKLLQDDEEGVAELESFLLAAPAEYSATVLQACTFELRFYPHVDGDPIKFPRWLVKLVLALLTRREWVSLGSDAISSTFIILRLSRDTLKHLSRQGVLSEVALEMLLSVIKEKPRHRQAPELDFGFLRGTYFSSDWSLESRPPSITLSTESQSFEGKGILDLLYRVFRFATAKTFSNMSLLLESLDEASYTALTATSSDVSALIPIDVSDSIPRQLSELRSLDESGFANLVSNRKVGTRVLSRPIEWLQLGTVFDADNWKRLVNQDVAWALRLWAEDFWEGNPGARDRPIIIDNRESMEFLVDALIASPNVLGQFPHLWGRLLANAYDRQSALRAVLLRIAKPRTRIAKSWRRSSGQYVFALRLPDEATLLPYLFGALCSEYGIATIYDEDIWASHGRPDARNLSAEIAKMVPSVADLEEVINDSRLATPIRAAALFMSLMHPNSVRTLNDSRDEVTGLYSTEIGIWYFEAVILLVTVFNPAEDSVNALFIGSVLERTRADYIGRQALQPLLTKWRETSTAPIHSANVQADWLTTD